jgi:DNA modification methylase
MYVQHSIEILRELRRVLRPDGVLFWNIGDSYAATTKGSGGHNPKQDSNAGSWFEDLKWTISRGLKPKDLCLIPARIALAAQADGWWVRSDIIWSKPNPMPESVRDRPTDAYEHILMFTKSERYFWDAEAVKEAQTQESVERRSRSRLTPYSPPGQTENTSLDRPVENGATRNLRNVWEFATQPFVGAHFATFPEEIPYRCIAAATSAKGACPKCHAPWQRILEKPVPPKDVRTKHHGPDDGLVMGFGSTGDRYGTGQKMQDWLDAHPTKTIGWEPTCRCSPAPSPQHLAPCLVLDPFAGSGTVGEVAFKMGRRFVCIDLAYQDFAKERIGALSLQM